MTHFLKRQNFSDKIFLLGSYHSDNIKNLENLRNFLKLHGYSNTFLAFEKEIENKNLDINSKSQEFYEKVEYLLESSDYCFFIFFKNHNQSLLVELVTYLKSDFFLNQKRKFLVIVPQPPDFDIKTILDGLFYQQEVEIFQYNDFSEINKKCLNYILYQ